MEQREVLSIASVDRIRFYVKRKYDHLTKEKHAEIVADAIVKIIMRQLPPFPDELKENICQELVKNVIIAKQCPVQIEDIYRASVKQVQSCDDPGGKLMELLEEWRSEQSVALVPLRQQEGIAKQEESRAAITAALKHGKKAVVYGLGCVAIIGGVLTAQLIQHFKAQENAGASSLVNGAQVELQTDKSDENRLIQNELPSHYQFHEVDADKLKAYLETRSSLLVEPQYFDAIVAAAEQFNISPVLMFAITGQEQGFVPREHEQAEKIANNPFNVFHSWQDYNTTIEKSSEIAGRTIVNLSKDRPENVDAITWINRKYAEDPNWSKGVISLFNTITKYIND